MSDLEQFIVGVAPSDMDSVPEFVQRFAQHVEEYLQQQFNENPVPVYNTAPERPFDGMLVIADGTDWNPGSGTGLYIYYNTWQLVKSL